MLLVLIALISVTVLSIWLKGKMGYHGGGDIAALFAILGFASLLVYCIFVILYVSAGYKVDIINREYKTNYTRSEMFYASGVIETVRELHRERVEINGNIITGRGSEHDN